MIVKTGCGTDGALHSTNKHYLLYTECRDAVLARAECLERDQRGGGREQLLITEDMTRPERIQVTLRHTASHCVTMHCVTSAHAQWGELRRHMARTMVKQPSAHYFLKTTKLYIDNR